MYDVMQQVLVVSIELSLSVLTAFHYIIITMFNEM